MSAFLPSLLIFLLILPALIFNLSFYQTENVPLRYIPLTHKTIVCALMAIIIHTVGAAALFLFGYEAYITKILTILAGLHKSQLSSAILSIKLNEIIVFLAYLFMLYATTYLIGRLLRFLIRYLKLERFQFFRFDSPWYYLFTGYDWEHGKPDGIRIAATIEMAGQCYLYIGWLHKFYLDSTGNIDRLVLRKTMRREIGNDKNDKKEMLEGPKANQLHNRFYKIDGYYFVLKYSEVKNLNVQFLNLKEIMLEIKQSKK